MEKETGGGLPNDQLPYMPKYLSKVSWWQVRELGTDTRKSSYGVQDSDKILWVVQSVRKNEIYFKEKLVTAELKSSIYFNI